MRGVDLADEAVEAGRRRLVEARRRQPAGDRRVPADDVGGLQRRAAVSRCSRWRRIATWLRTRCCCRERNVVRRAAAGEGGGEVAGGERQALEPEAGVGGGEEVGGPECAGRPGSSSAARRRLRSVTRSHAAQSTAAAAAGRQGRAWRAASVPPVAGRLAGRGTGAVAGPRFRSHGDRLPPGRFIPLDRARSRTVQHVARDRCGAQPNHQPARTNSFVRSREACPGRRRAADTLLQRACTNAAAVVVVVGYSASSLVSPVRMRTTLAIG